MQRVRVWASDTAPQQASRSAHVPPSATANGPHAPGIQQGTLNAPVNVLGVASIDSKVKLPAIRSLVDTVSTISPVIVYGSIPTTTLQPPPNVPSGLPPLVLIAY